ncbi:MAG: CDP-diacylglycerol--serine O-phosphatidyltransferase [Lacibacter sp.]
MIRAIPNIFTLLNLVCGCIAIVLILQPEESVAYLKEGVLFLRLPEKMVYASLFLFAAAIIDFLDGFLARLLRATSDMGKQLDSLSDVVSFGVAPSLILYQLLRMSFMQQSNGLDTPGWYFVPAVLFACAGAWRLARFNIDQRQSRSFRGVPIPISGLVVASLPLMLWFSHNDIAAMILQPWVLYIIIFILSGFMVSSVPIMSLKLAGLGVKQNRPQYLLLALSLLLIVIFQWQSVILIYLTYVVLSLLLRNKIS